MNLLLILSSNGEGMFLHSGIGGLDNGESSDDNDDDFSNNKNMYQKYGHLLPRAVKEPVSHSDDDMKESSNKEDDAGIILFCTNHLS